MHKGKKVKIEYLVEHNLLVANLYSMPLIILDGRDGLSLSVPTSRIIYLVSSYITIF